MRQALQAVVRHNLCESFHDFRHGYRVFADEDDARAVMRENGMLEDESDPAVCDCERAQFEQMPDDNVLAVRDEDADPIARVVKTCEQWASEGRGYLAGTVW